MPTELLQLESLWSLVTLLLMEVVLGIDNIVFLSILTDRLPVRSQPLARRLGLSLALVLRLGLLFTLSWIMSLKEPLFAVLGHDVSARDLILVGGGLFLVAKATHEIYDRMEVAHAEAAGRRMAPSVAWAIVQIVILDLVFSLDSVITAVGMARHLAIMVVAMVAAVLIMMTFAGRIGTFISKHPSMKILALSFLLLVGVLLIAEGTGRPIDKGYVYFAMFFALGVELVNMRIRRGRERPVHLHHRFEDERQG